MAEGPRQSGAGERRTAGPGEAARQARERHGPGAKGPTAPQTHLRRPAALTARGPGARPERRRTRRASRAVPRRSHASEVAAHQRERLMEAMVQAVSERGVVATTISDLVARAGISRRTFYEHFENKEACLLATYDTVVETEVQRLLATRRRRGTGGGSSWRRSSAQLFDAIAERPDAARLICVEMGASGAVGVQRWADGAARFEHFISAGFERAPGPGTIPDPVARAFVGALRKIVYTRVREERSNKSLKAELARIVPELWSGSAATTPPLPESPPPPPTAAALAGGRPRARDPLAAGALGSAGAAARRAQPPARLRGLQPARADLRRDRQTHRQRRLPGAEPGGHRRGGGRVSLQTFYTHFENKEEAFLATYEVGHTRAKAAVNRALAHQTDWIGGVRAGAHGAARVPRLRARPRAPRRAWTS